MEPRVGDSVTWMSGDRLAFGVIVLLADGFVLNSDGEREAAQLASVDTGESSFYRCVRADNLTRDRVPVRHWRQ